MYEKVDTNLNFVSREKKIRDFWRENKIADLAITNREGKETYTFYDGPPTANGKPHIGHVLTRVIKDLFPRYQSMKGKKVLRKAGWDTHGLPVELEVEKALGLDGKEQIEEYGIEPFLKKCRESVWQYKAMWEEFSDAVGFWADMEHPYITYDNDFIESEWWALKKIWEKGLLYKGYKVVPYCPRCGTPLSSHEVAQGYKEIEEHSAIVKFKAQDEDAFFLAWTTTPWTLPSNLGLCVNPNVEYVKIEVSGTVYYLAESLVDSVFGENAGERKILQKMTGKELEYRTYEPLYPYALGKIDKQAFYVMCDSYVTTTDGTGIVHCAPAFGEDDARVCKSYGMPLVQFVDARGNLTKDTDFAGIFVKDADPLILKDLQAKEKLFKAPLFKHNYPHCWRCDTPLIYYARDSWFIKMTAVRDKLMENNNTVNWLPKSIGQGRFGDWLKNVQDWGISRNRYWGTPLNIWECSCSHQEAIGSIEELKKLSANCPENIELHRPYIDQVTICCPKCGKEMKRVTEVIDCWFDSGSMPFAQWHYPFENKEIFENHFPAHFISEAVDQTRGWFYSLIAIATVLFDKAPYENVIVLGHVLDKYGRKMSKSKGNAVDPMVALKKHGADAIRWYFYENSAPYLPNRYHDEAVEEGQRKFMGTLWNTYAFYILYANIDSFNATKYELKYDTLSVLDKWILSRLNSTVQEVDEHLSNYHVTESAKTLQKFVDELSNWYLRQSRERFWGKELTQDKINAYKTLYKTLDVIIRVSAPLIPFMTESIYQNLVRKIDKKAPLSVHLTDFPLVEGQFINQELEKNMSLVLEIVVLGRAARNKANIKNRQPLSKIYVRSNDKLDSFFSAIVENELNVKKVFFTDDIEDYVKYKIKPQFRILGKKVGKNMKLVQEKLSKISGYAFKEKMQADGKYTLDLAGESLTLVAEDIEIVMEEKSGYVCQHYGSVTVALDTILTDELVEEGFVREIISKIQTMRKENGFEVTDRIKVYLQDNEKLIALVEKNATTIGKIVLANEFIYCKMGGFTKQWNINGEQLTLGVEK